MAARGSYFFLPDLSGKSWVFEPDVRSTLSSDALLYFSGMTWIVSSSLLGGSLPTTCLPVFLYQMISTRYFPGGGPLAEPLLYLASTMAGRPLAPLLVPRPGTNERP